MITSLSAIATPFKLLFLCEHREAEQREEKGIVKWGSPALFPLKFQSGGLRHDLG